MKKSNEIKKLVFSKKNIVELNNKDLRKLNGGRGIPQIASVGGCSIYEREYIEHTRKQEPDPYPLTGPSDSGSHAKLFL
jgi:hypothetical protein